MAQVPLEMWLAFRRAAPGSMLLLALAQGSPAPIAGPQAGLGALLRHPHRAHPPRSGRHLESQLSVYEGLSPITLGLGKSRSHRPFSLSPKGPGEPSVQRKLNECCEQSASTQPAPCACTSTTAKLQS